MEQNQPNGGHELKNEGDDREGDVCSHQETNDQIDQPLEKQELPIILESNTFTNELSAIESSLENQPIKESENSFDDVKLNKIDHPPPSFLNDPIEKESVPSVEAMENPEFVIKNYNEVIDLETIPPGIQQVLSDNNCSQEYSTKNDEANVCANIQSSENQDIVKDDHIKIENEQYTGENKINNEIPSSQNEICTQANSKPNLINSSTDLSEEKESIAIIDKNDQFLDLDIPKPVFSSDDESESNQQLDEFNDHNNNSQPVDLDQIIKKESLEESSEECQEKISNQSSQRVEAPQAFIPSSQLMMTKKALDEGNSFLKVILSKLRNINQYLTEKISKETA